MLTPWSRKLIVAQLINIPRKLWKGYLPCVHQSPPLDRILSQMNPVGFEVLTAVNTKMAVFWVAAPCSLIDVYQLIALMMEAASTSETLDNLYQTTRRYNPEDSHLQMNPVHILTQKVTNSMGQRST
jgi:hypothetical protein